MRKLTYNFYVHKIIFCMENGKNMVGQFEFASSTTQANSDALSLWLKIAEGAF